MDTTDVILAVKKNLKKIKKKYLVIRNPCITFANEGKEITNLSLHPLVLISYLFCFINCFCHPSLKKMDFFCL